MFAVFSLKAFCKNKYINASTFIDCFLQLLLLLLFNLIFFANDPSKQYNHNQSIGCNAHDPKYGPLVTELEEVSMY